MNDHFSKFSRPCENPQKLKSCSAKRCTTLNLTEGGSLTDSGQMTVSHGECNTCIII